jgi:cation diffusion facilitator CzcD-associated flavoprotein CzcO
VRGPFGLALAAHVQQLGIDYLQTGKPMEFWKKNMPHGMYLRSASDWYLDADDEHTIEKFTRIKKLATHDVEPLSLRYYLSYVDWYIEQKRLDPLPVYIERLDYEKEYCYRAVTNDGETIHAKKCRGSCGAYIFQIYSRRTSSAFTTSFLLTYL